MTTTVHVKTSPMNPNIIEFDEMETGNWYKCVSGPNSYYVGMIGVHIGVHIDPAYNYRGVALTDGTHVTNDAYKFVELESVSITYTEM